MIRSATVADAPAIAALEAWPAAAIASTLALPTTRAFVAVEAGEIVGDAIATAVADEGEVVLLAVRADRRRAGVGSRLLDRVEQAWREAGVHDAWLEVRVDNAAALALYASRGWRRDGARRGYYRDGTDALVMRWSG